MKVIIDISKDLYNRIFDGEIALNTDDKWELEESVRLSIMHGKVLPKTHGRLIDADKMIGDILTIPRQYEELGNWCIQVTEGQPIIIEAESEGKNDA